MSSTSKNYSDDNRRVVKSKSRSKTTQLLKKHRHMFDDKIEESSSDEKNLHNSKIEEEEEEDNDDCSSHQIRKKKKKTRVHEYINDEAEVDDDIDDDEEEWEEGAYEHVVNEADEAGPTARDIEGRRRMDSLLESYDSENIEEYFQKKYADQRELQNRFGHGSCMSDEINQKSLLPAITDPKLWSVKCRIGEEKKTALLLMRKFLTYANTDKPLQIKSVVVPESVKGYVYIESYKQAHVKAAIEGVSALNQYKQEIVPIKEMTDIMKVLKLNVTLKRNQWVRIKRGIYKDDIAQVYHVAESQNKVELKLLPKIDYTRMRGALKTVAQNNPDAPKKKPKRPTTAKLFDPEAVRAIGGEVVKNYDFYVFEGNKYTEKGFLIKSFPLNAINSDNVQPTLSELEKFELSPETIALELGDPGTGTATKINNYFSTGDNVEVCNGELLNLRGKITAVNGDTITIMPNHKDLKGPIEFDSHDLRKYFEQGNYVRVLSGNYAGNNGFVEKIQSNGVVVVCMIESGIVNEIETLSQDLQLCDNVASGVDNTFCQYQNSQRSKNIIYKKRSDSIKNEYIQCTQGMYKGHTGFVKEENNNIVLVTLDSLIKPILIKKTNLNITPANKSESFVSTTPLYNGKDLTGVWDPKDSDLSAGVREFIVQDRVKILKGDYKDKKGKIKKITDTLIEVEVYTKPPKLISVNINDIKKTGQK